VGVLKKTKSKPNAGASEHPKKVVGDDPGTTNETPLIAIAVGSESSTEWRLWK